MKRNLALFATILAVYSCGSSEKKILQEEKTQSMLEKAGWLVGHWENSSHDTCFSETWTKDGENGYTAETYMVSGKDTLFREHSVLKKSGNTLECVISIPGENNDKPVAFTMTRQTENTMRFENPGHDFPQVISYMHKGDSVIAEISGRQDGKFAKERFAMVKVK